MSTDGKEAWDECVYTDAPNDHWGAIVTQLAPGDLSKTRAEQDYFPLAFISVSFRGSMLRWATIEKEANAIVEMCEKLEYLSLSKHQWEVLVQWISLDDTENS